jgi:hypothetical protein
MNPNMPAGTTLKGLGLNLILEDTEFLTEAGSCGEDEYLFRRRVPFSLVNTRRSILLDYRHRASWLLE